MCVNASRMSLLLGPSVSELGEILFKITSSYWYFQFILFLKSFNSDKKKTHSIKFTILYSRERSKMAASRLRVPLGP